MLQNHYPERLGCVVCYKAPSFFSLIWRVSHSAIDAPSNNVIRFRLPLTKSLLLIISRLIPLALSRCSVPLPSSTQSPATRWISSASSTAAAAATPTALASPRRVRQPAASGPRSITCGAARRLLALTTASQDPMWKLLSQLPTLIHSSGPMTPCKIILIWITSRWRWGAGMWGRCLIGRRSACW